MPFFQYTGDADDGTLATQAFGLLFPKGFSVEVVDDYAVAKLRANPRFAEVNVSDADEQAAPRRGRPPKPRDVADGVGQ